MDIENAVTEHAKSPATFSIVDRRLNRGMPEEDVTIYLNEKLGWELMRLEAKHLQTARSEDLEPIEARIAEVRAALAKEAYVFTMGGISNERYDELIDEALESHPYEYAEELNPLTMQKSKVLVPSDERDGLFNTLFLAEATKKITDPSGAVDENVTPESIALFKKHGPVDGIRRVTALAIEMRMLAEWMDTVETEDFSPKP